MRFVYRHYAFIGQESNWAAEASECAGAQGKFWPYYDRLNATAASGRDSGAFAKDVLKRYAAELGLNVDTFGSCLDVGQYGDRVRAETAAGAGRGVNSTPSLFVAGRKLQGVPEWNDLLRAVTDAGGR